MLALRRALLNQFGLSNPKILNFSTKSSSNNASRLIDSSLRVDYLAQIAATSLASGRLLASRIFTVHGSHRPDLQALLQQEQENLESVKQRIPVNNVRPSLLGPITSVAFKTIGAISALAPFSISSAVASGIQDGLSDTFNEQLRDLINLESEEGIDALKDVRQITRDLRDQQRAPEGAPDVPDLVSLAAQFAAGTGEGEKITAAQAVAALSKAGTRVLLDMSKKL